jgi:pre-rRNA-processing protein TSR3
VFPIKPPEDFAPPLPFPVVIIRHPKEKRRKCTVEPLRGRPGFTFYNARPGFVFEASNCLLLSVDAPCLSPADAAWLNNPPSPTREENIEKNPTHAKRTLLLLDAAWRLLPVLEKCLSGIPRKRSLPATLKTAYPRLSKMTEDPTQGLASIEALYAALALLGHNDPGLLDDYHWKEDFLEAFGAIHPA